MCFRTKNNKTFKQLEDRFKARFLTPEWYTPEISNAFAFAGLLNTWTNKNTLETLNAYTITTTAANELMSEIHNTKKRMPVMLSPEAENDWLKGGGEFIMQNDLIQAVPSE
ncbi:SOS response-associated peptidase family protein [Marinilabilia salmonicolor]|uniref:SOS response-associated peptidase family protein n=1 Tax=Marinilabilia salmonicolor TaxID=989 RepID=UPI00029B18C3|nr:SOS response-associated peptidase family protein [Marinilabilia salmonicolor]